MTFQLAHIDHPLFPEMRRYKQSWEYIQDCFCLSEHNYFFQIKTALPDITVSEVEFVVTGAAQVKAMSADVTVAINKKSRLKTEVVSMEPFILDSGRCFYPLHCDKPAIAVRQLTRMCPKTQQVAPLRIYQILEKEIMIPSPSDIEGHVVSGEFVVFSEPDKQIPMLQSKPLVGEARLFIEDWVTLMTNVAEFKNYLSLFNRLEQVWLQRAIHGIESIAVSIVSEVRSGITIQVVYMNVNCKGSVPDSDSYLLMDRLFHALQYCMNLTENYRLQCGEWTWERLTLALKHG